MNKKVLIISPYFAPSNAADMQRIRMSLPYFKDFGWDAEVVSVDPKYSEILKDDLLIESIPSDIKIHKVNAISKRWTSKFGLGSLALRSLFYYLKKVNQLLKAGRYDLIYFSTTQFPITVLGAYWKKKFRVPYVIDMQDPWHSEYYRDKAKDQRPPKYWFSYRLNKYLEPLAVKSADGLVSVSESYIIDLQNRYPGIASTPAETITFGVFPPDFEIAKVNRNRFAPLLIDGLINIVYVGRGGNDMHQALSLLFQALKKGLRDDPALFGKLKFYFFGTSYAPEGKGKPTVLPLAKDFDVEGSIVEVTDRISYYHAISTLLAADALFVPGSDAHGYTASKIFPYLLTGKPLIAIFKRQSTIVDMIRKNASNVNIYTFPPENHQVKELLYNTLLQLANRELQPVVLSNNFKDFNAKSLTSRQIALFDRAINHFERKNSNA